jgi:hypothetical protein
MKILKFKTFKFKARISISLAVSELLRRFAPPKAGALGDKEVGYFELNIFIHDLARGSSYAQY